MGSSSIFHQMYQHSEHTVSQWSDLKRNLRPCPNVHLTLFNSKKVGSDGDPLNGAIQRLIDFTNLKITI